VILTLSLFEIQQVKRNIKIPVIPRIGGKIKLNIPPSPRNAISPDVDRKNEIIENVKIIIIPFATKVIFLAFRTTRIYMLLYAGVKKL